MPIAISCSGCHATFRLPDELAGKKVRCQKCKHMFDVPTASALAESKPPIISMELDEPKPAEEIIDAVLAEPAKEIIDAKPVEESSTKKEEIVEVPIVDAISAKEPPRRTTPPSLPKQSPSPQLSVSTSPRKRTASPDSSRSVVGPVLAGVLVCLLLGICGVSGFGAYWLFGRRPARPIAVVPAKKEGEKIEQIQNPPIIDKKNERAQPLVPKELQLDGNGKASVNDTANLPVAANVDPGRFNNEGALCLYRVALQQGKPCNFHVKTTAFTPRIRLYDGDVRVAEQQSLIGGIVGGREVFLSYTANRTGDHLILITSLNQGLGGNFDLSFAPVSPLQVMPIDLVANAKISTLQALRIDDPILPDGFPGCGPYREYALSLEANQNYEIAISGFNFSASVGIYKDNRLLQPSLLRLPFDVRPFTYHCLAGGEYRLRVGSTNGSLGNYVLTASRRMDGLAAQNPMRIIVLLDEQGRLEDRRTLTSNDPKEPTVVNRGPHKQYLISLSKGKNYSFELTSQTLFMQATLYDENNKLAVTQACKPNARNTFFYRPESTATYRLDVAAAIPKTVGAYTLNIRDKDVDEVKPVPTLVAFDADGGYRKEDQLTEDDPSEKTLGFFKTYLVPIEAGFSYNFEQKSKDIDPYLKLHDPKGELVAFDNNSGDVFNARIIFNARTTGQYRLQAYDFKNKTGSFTLEINRFKLPVSIAVDQPLKTKKTREAGCDLVTADFGRALAKKSFFAWAPDGKAFFLLEEEALCRIRLSDFVEERRLPVGKGCDQVTLTSKGLLLANPTTRELWLIDPQTLEVTTRLAQRHNGLLFTSPNSKMAYANAQVLKPDGTRHTGLCIYDLDLLRVGLTADFPALIQFLGLTPDGNYLLGRSSDQKLIRWRVNGDKIQLEEIARSPLRTWVALPIVVSADSQWVVHPISNKVNPKIAVQVPVGFDYGLAAYKIDDLKQPAFALNTDSFPYTAAIDPKTGVLCTHSNAKGVIFGDLKGNVLLEVPIEKTNNKVASAVKYLSPYPEGGNFLAICGSFNKTYILSIEPPKDLQAQPKQIEKKKIDP